MYILALLFEFYLIYSGVNLIKKAIEKRFYKPKINRIQKEKPVEKSNQISIEKALKQQEKAMQQAEKNRQKQEQAEAIKDVIKFVMIEKETEEISGSGWRATWHNTKTERIDSKALKAALPEVYQEYSKTTMSTRFTLNKIKTA